MTIEERKRLGINKLTLWYIKKNMSDGKTTKIYEKILLKIQSNLKIHVIISMAICFLNSKITRKSSETELICE